MVDQCHLPGGPDELGDVGGQLVEAVEVIGSEASVQAAAEALGGLGGVLGDVPSHLLGRELPRLLTVLGDVVDVELLPPAGIPVRPVVQRRAGHADSRDGQAERLLEEGGGERLWGRGETARTAAVGGCVQADDGVEVDRPTSLESATFAYDTRTTCRSPASSRPTSQAKARWMAMVVRRHSSGARAFQSTCAGAS